MNLLLIMRSANAGGRRRLVIIALVPLMLSLILPSAGAQTLSHFSTAAEHAAIAAEANKLTEIHQHLQYVLNCLEGATGEDYKKVADNPCTGQGALQTLPEHSANRARAQKSIALARVGVTLHDVPPAHYVAKAILAILTEDQQR